LNAGKEGKDFHTAEADFRIRRGRAAPLSVASGWANFNPSK
jgi:hypothetical protein